MRQAILMNHRSDGRTDQQRRDYLLQSNVLDHLAGSSSLSIKLDNIEIYTGVKLKIEDIDSQKTPFTIQLELSSMRLNSSPMLSYLQHLLQRYYLDPSEELWKEQLIIPHSQKHRLGMYIQVFILNDPHPSLLGLLSVAIGKAISSTIIPELHCSYNEITGQETVEALRGVKNLANCIVDEIEVVGILDGSYVRDLTLLEYEAMDAVLLVACKAEKILAVHSLKGSMCVQQLHKISRMLASLRV